MTMMTAEEVMDQIAAAEQALADLKAAAMPIVVKRGLPVLYLGQRWRVVKVTDDRAVIARGISDDVETADVPVKVLELAR